MTRKKNSAYERHKELQRERQRRYLERLTDEKREAKKKYDRERMARLRAEKKIKSIKDMTPREQRKMRKYWRERNNIRNEKKKALTTVLADTPPQSPAPGESVQRRRGRRKIRKEKAKVYRTVHKQKKEIRSLKKRLERYKKRLQREKEKSRNLASPSPRKQVQEVLGKEKVSPAVKRQLFLGFALRKQIRSQKKLLAGTKKKNQIIHKYVGNKVLKKYRVQRHFNDILPYYANRMLNNDSSLEYSRKKKTSIMKELSQQIEQFYEDDKVSRMCPGKRDFVKKGSVKKQRRVLLLPLQELHKIFKEETKCKISFSTFSRARPFWVSLPKKSDRETCACIKHTNIELLISALKQSKVITERNPREVIKSVVCSIDEEDCLMGKCDKCKNNNIKFTYESDFKLKFFKWKIVVEEKVIRNTKKVLKKTKKVKVLKNISKVQADFQAELKAFKKHVLYAKHQINSINDKIKNISADELVFRIDFSENYVTKLATEVQSYHFGASKPQLSINTGLRYAKVADSLQTFCFATVSDNTDHQAHAVWAHMNPILKQSAEEFPNTKIVHFVSDSPSSQYRNRFNLHLFNKLIPKYFKSIDTMTWNYTEAGHGKGPMDGVGGTLKRMCDRKVAYGEDIKCSKDFVNAVKDSKIHLVEVSSEDIEKMKNNLSQKIEPIVGIMRVHQFTFSANRMYDARELSCFKCPPRKTCSHYGTNVVPAVGTSSKKKNKKVDFFDPKPCGSSTVSKPSIKKSKLSVDVVYTSSEDEEYTNHKEDKEKPLCLQDLIDSINDEEIDWKNLQPGDYVLVAYSNEKKKSQVQHYVGVCQSKVNNNEIDVTFMKQLTKQLDLYFVDEKDCASVPISQLKAIMPQPKIIVKGYRVFYKFLQF